MADARVETEPLLRWFASDHLAEHLRPIVYSYRVRALWLVETLPRSAERTVALRKLIESKDAAVRAAVETDTNG